MAHRCFRKYTYPCWKEGDVVRDGIALRPPSNVNISISVYCNCENRLHWPLDFKLALGWILTRLPGLEQIVIKSSPIFILATQYSVLSDLSYCMAVHREGSTFDAGSAYPTHMHEEAVVHVTA